MRWNVRALALLLCFAPFGAFAALTTGDQNRDVRCPVAVNQTSTCTQDAPCSASGKAVTFYVPHNSPGCERSIEGCIATSRKNSSGFCDDPMTVDCVRFGKCTYASCASDPSNYGKFFNLGSVTYRSALDQKIHTVPNVTCFVHDTGSAFNGRPDKLDLATTICPTCNNQQAGQIAMNAEADLLGPGRYDTNSQQSGQNCVVSTQPLVVVPCNSIANRSNQPQTSASSPAQALSPTASPQNPLGQSISASNLLNTATPLLENKTAPPLSTSILDLLNTISAATSSNVTSYSKPISIFSRPTPTTTSHLQTVGRMVPEAREIVPSVPIPANPNTFISPDLSALPQRPMPLFFSQPVLSQLNGIVSGIIEFLSRLRLATQ